MPLLIESETYCLPRGGEEIERLNRQHLFIRALFNGNLIHPHIPLSQIRSVADVGTGTGAWLLDTRSQLLQNQLQQHNKKVQSPLQFVGFDISDAQFPLDVGRRRDECEGRSDLDFVVHDLLQPFPAEYHGQFDLVHLRLLVGGTRVEDIPTYLQHVSSLLRPGGYLSWQDLDFADIWTEPFHPAVQAFTAAAHELQLQRKSSLSLPQDLLRSLLSLQTPLRDDGTAAAWQDGDGDGGADGPVNAVTNTNATFRLLAFDKSLTHAASDKVQAKGNLAQQGAWVGIAERCIEQLEHELLSLPATGLALGRGGSESGGGGGGGVDAVAEAEEEEEEVEVERRRLRRRLEDRRANLEEVKAAFARGEFRWQWGITWLVARKTHFCSRDPSGSFMRSRRAQCVGS
ncbi:hypothetical protein H2203_008727 [Taxawa tesnikishii (nom. ined.)]|nr:hypothetical protein H2203_008727 [Dothideales sp. JES 119]